MTLLFAYIGVVLIWATTPLAIQWSSESVGYLFGISARFILGAIAVVMIAWLSGKRLQLSRDAILTYLIAGTAASAAMYCVYWGSQYIPSGWVSLIFGLSPIMTALLAAQFLGEKGLTPIRLLSILLSLGGLYIMLETGSAYHADYIYGIVAVLLSALFYSMNLVFVKWIDADIDSFSSVCGTLPVMAIIVAIVWFASGQALPNAFPLRVSFSIAYLAVIGSVLGFMLFYYVLKRIEATKTSLVALITPVCALLLGHFANNEPLNHYVASGAILILTGLLLFQFEVGIERKIKLAFLRKET